MNTENLIPESQETLPPPPVQPSALDQKILLHFPGLVVRKDLTNSLKQNAVVPTYVLEYLLGQHCATDDTEVLKTGLESVKRILAKHYVHRNQSELVKSTIKERGQHKVIDKLTVELNEKGGFYETEFTNLGIKRVPISDDFVRRHPKLLVGGIWCIVDVTYEVGDSPKSSPWQIDTLKPIQVSSIDLDAFMQAHAAFTSEEWTDVLMQSMGFNPELFTRRTKLLTLARLIPYCERNYNMLELGPKGTGKSHIYAEFSPHGILISGSEVSTPKLFVSNNSGKIGLVGYWDCICFDEFAGKDKKIDKALVDIMKNYMANRSFSRGIEQLFCRSLDGIHGQHQKIRCLHAQALPFFRTAAGQIHRLRFSRPFTRLQPGWEVAPIRHELFTSGYGFIVDYVAEVLKHLRTEDFTGTYKKYFEIASEVSTRDQTGFEKTFSGLMKILYPSGQATAQETEELLSFSMECRRRVREHLLRIDDTFKRHDFIYKPLNNGPAVTVLTPEEIQYPAFANPKTMPTEAASEKADNQGSEAESPAAPAQKEPESELSDQPTHIVVPENTKGWSYSKLFGHHLKGARKIIISDPYVRLFFQARNLMELLQMIHDLVPEGDEAEVELITQSDPDSCVRQEENLNQIAEAFDGSRVAFSWKFNHNPSFHARSITTDTGWKILIDRGLDMFQRYETGPFSLEQALQDTRLTRRTEITYLRNEV